MRLPTRAHEAAGSLPEVTLALCWGNIWETLLALGKSTTARGRYSPILCSEYILKRRLFLRELRKNCVNCADCVDCVDCADCMAACLTSGQAGRAPEAQGQQPPSTVDSAARGSRTYSCSKFPSWTCPWTQCGRKVLRETEPHGRLLVWPTRSQKACLN